MKKCKHCGKEFEKQGQLNLHQYHCMIRMHRKEQSVPRETLLENGKERCEHSFRLLNGNVPIEARAIQNGYVEVCSKCQSVQ